MTHNIFHSDHPFLQPILALTQIFEKILCASQMPKGSSCVSGENLDSYGQEEEMRIIQQTAKPVSVFVAISLFLAAVPYQPAIAAMIGTETVLDAARAQEGRQYLRVVLARKDVQNVLTARGIDPEEAKARVDALSDSEVVQLAEQIEQLPSGGDGLGVVIGGALFVFLVLLITDILGFTDVFPWVKSRTEVARH